MRNKGMQLGAVLVAMLIVSMLFVPAVSAQAEKEKVNKKIVKIIQLQPESGSEVILNSSNATRWSDDSISFGGSGEKRVGEPALYFSIEVNISKGTYKTIKRNISNDIEFTPVLSKVEIYNNELVPNILTAGVKPGTWLATIQMITKDPALWDLAKTTHTLTWTVNPSGTVTYKGRIDSCWAANPSPLNTHWYVDSCNFQGSYLYSADYTALFSTVDNKFHNWDFMNQNQATYVEHWNQIKGRNDGYYNYWIDFVYAS
ncbi:MAG: hypothetical protein O8C65_02500 [Candidatus Methanoperedens sp.]|nr:hypothetical protein [Candidatus Methanoperedens sp.]